MVARVVTLPLMLLLVILGLIGIWYLGSEKTVRVELRAACLRLPGAGWGA